MSPIKREFSGFAKPLQVVGFIATRKGDVERGPMVRLRPEDALIRLLMPGELVRVISDRRSELAELQVDELCPRAAPFCVMLRARPSPKSSAWYGWISKHRVRRDVVHER